MVILRDTRRFEMTVEAYGGSFLAKLQGFVPGRLYPTLYLMREVTTRTEAITAVMRAWQRLFPDEEPLHWHEPALPLLSSIPRRSRHTAGRET